MNQILICKYDNCNKYFLNPIILPCGETICEVHAQRCLNCEFNCYFCAETHQVPKNGFTINNAIIRLLQLRQHLNEEKKKGLDLINKLKSFEIEFDTKTVKNDHFTNIRYQIDIDKEIIKQQIDNVALELLEQVTDYENKFKFNQNRQIDLKYEIKNDLDELKIKNIPLWETEFRMVDIDEARVKELNDLLEKNLEYFDRRIKVSEKSSLNLSFISNFNSNLFLALKNKIFDPKILKTVKQIKQEPSQQELLKQEQIQQKLEQLSQVDTGRPELVNKDDDDDCDLKTNKSNSFLMDSKILTTFEQQINLMNLCEFNLNDINKLELIYRATDDGFSKGDFYKKCINKSKTLIVIQEKEHSYIFGGYAEKAWKCGWVDDPQSFIFSLVNHENISLKIKVKDETHSIFAKKNWGPCFGNDIGLYSDSNKNEYSYSDLGHAYEHPNYPYNSNRAKNLLAGSYNFSTSEIEIYQIESANKKNESKIIEESTSLMANESNNIDKSGIRGVIRSRSPIYEIEEDKDGHSVSKKTKNE